MDFITEGTIHIRIDRDDFPLAVQSLMEHDITFSVLRGHHGELLSFRDERDRTKAAKLLKRVASSATS